MLLRLISESVPSSFPQQTAILEADRLRIMWHRSEVEAVRSKIAGIRRWRLVWTWELCVRMYKTRWDDFLEIFLNSIRSKFTSRGQKTMFFLLVNLLLTNISLFINVSPVTSHTYGKSCSHWDDWKRLTFSRYYRPLCFRLSSSPWWPQ